MFDEALAHENAFRRELDDLVPDHSPARASEARRRREDIAVVRILVHDDWMLDAGVSPREYEDIKRGAAMSQLTTAVRPELLQKESISSIVYMSLLFMGCTFLAIYLRREGSNPVAYVLPLVLSGFFLFLSMLLEWRITKSRIRS